MHRHGRQRTRLTKLLGLGVTLLVTTAGACQEEFEGPLPSPDEAGARPFPDGARTTGLDATYARLIREDPDGTQCFSLLRLTKPGEAQLGQGCSTTSADDIAADDDTWSGREFLGDYAHGDNRVWVRIVSWNALEEVIDLGEHEFVPCGLELRSTEETDPFRVVYHYTLVDGTAPPDAPLCDP